MRYFISSGIVALSLILSCQVSAQNHKHYSPPAPYAIQVILPDGEQLNIMAKGNDDNHWTETTDGYTILKNSNGYYEYAIEKNGRFVHSGIRASDPEKRSLGEMRQLLSKPKHLIPEKSIGTIARSNNIQPLSSTDEERPAVPSKGKIKLLAICIEYPDLPHRKEVDYFSKLMNEGIEGNPSFRDYYLNNSYGKLDISVDVVGWVQASKSYSYYSEQNGRRRSQELVKEAIQAAESRGVDYSEYDNDLDDDVDAVIIIHSGPGAEEGGREEYIWSHRWTIPFEDFDNKFIFDYTIQPETRTASWYGESAGIGIFCHEFGHLLGLPDLYDTETFNGNSNGIGEWGLMGLGQWLGYEDYPAAMCAWSKEKLDWVEPKDITKSYGQYSLKSVEQNPQIYRIETGRKNEYFLLENRQRIGFDEFQKGSGLAIWHINADKANLYPISNSVNGENELKGIDLEEADGNADLDEMRNRADAGDLFPGSSHQTSFSVFTNPTSESYFSLNNSTETGISIENIAESADGTISFKHSRLFSNGGSGCENAIIAFDGKNSVNKTPSWFEFTMPSAGSLSISTGEAGRPTSSEVYLDCKDNIAAAQAISKNDSNEHIPIYFKYLAKGQKVLIHWLQVAGQSKPFTFSINIEGNVAQQDSLALVAMYNQMGGSSWSKQARWLSGPVSSWEGVSVENARVTKLNFSKAGLKGNLPDAFYNLKELRSLILDDNEISAGLNTKLGQLNKLEEIIIKEKKLNATFLSSVSSLKQLKKLLLTDVKLNEGIPVSIEQLTELEYLEIHNAALKGSIPSAIGKLKKLNNLILTNNQLTGIIPESIGGLWDLQSFSADNNQLTGAVPEDLMTLPALQSLSLENNRLNALPESFFSSNSLTSINISRNQINGNLPKTVNRTSAATLELNLSKNQLKGEISEALTKISFSQLDLSENQLEGDLPALKVASFLSIAFNHFSSLAKLTDLSQGSDQLVLWCQGNKLTFDDLLPNTEYISEGNSPAQHYNPQDTIISDIKQTVSGGGTMAITLQEDNELNSNRYAWYLNGNLVGNTKTGNLQINNFSEQKAGNYSCKITNTQLSGLTLIVDGIQLRLKSKEEQTITVETIQPKTYGDAEFNIEASSNANLPLIYTRISGPISLKTNKVTINGAGEARIKVSQAGNETYHAEEKEITFTIAKASQTINDMNVEAKTYGEESFALDVSATSGLPVVLAIESGNVALNNNVVSIEGTGGVSILASQPGNDDYLAASNKTIRFSIAKAAQSIDFPEIENQVYGNDPLQLSPTASSELPVNLRVVEGTAIWSEGELVMIGAGKVVVGASQAGDENYQVAPTVTRTFEVAKAEQEIFFEEILDRDLSDPPLELEAYSSVEGLEVNFRLLEGDAEINNRNILTANNTGKITVEAFHPGNNNFQAAMPMQRSFFVTSSEKQAQTIVLQVLPDTVTILEQLNLEWTVSSGLEPEINLEGPAVLQDDQLSFTGIGEVTIKMEQSGNEVYNAAHPVEYKVFVTKASQAISITQPKDAYLKDKTLILNANSDSGLPVLFRIISGEVTLEGDVLTFVQEGEVIIEAYQPGDDHYETAEPQRFSFRIFAEERLNQTLSFSEIPDKTFGDSSFDINIESSSKLPMTLEASGPVFLEGRKITIMGAGTAHILAYQKGNENYAPSDTINLLFEILPASQILQFELVKMEEMIYLLKASSNAKLPVTFEVIKGKAEIRKDTLVILGPEKVEVKAIQEGNENYLAAEPVSRVIDAGQVTSIDDVETKTIKIFPNPSNGIFQLELGELEKDRTLSIYDAKGKLLHRWENQWQHETIDLNNQAAGIYLLSIQDKGKTLHFRLIKQ